jgi:hypothetical protein
MLTAASCEVTKRTRVALETVLPAGIEERSKRRKALALGST